MKRFISLVLVLLTLMTLTIGLTACSPDYSKREFTFFGDDFSWDFSPAEAKLFIQVLQEEPEDVEIKEHESYTVVSDSAINIRFDENEKMEFIKLNTGFTIGVALPAFKDLYGEPDKVKDSGNFTSYIWYGTMDGVNTKATVYQPSGSSSWYVDFYRDD